MLTFFILLKEILVLRCDYSVKQFPRDCLEKGPEGPILSSANGRLLVLNFLTEN